jgi:hypothetical protein
MKKLLNVLVLLAMVLSACGKVPTSAPTPTTTNTKMPAIPETPTPLPTNTPTPTPIILYPPEGYGPSNFPLDVDPLTGLKVADPSMLQRRPMLIKVSNMPRDVRPQWGLSLADIIFEYYSEEGMTRFGAIFYSKDASLVGPIRSGRFIDGDLVRGYKAVFAFGGAYVAEMDRFLKSDFASRMVVEESYTPLKRYDPNGYNYLVVNSADLSAYATKRGINGIQNLDNMLFKLETPPGGRPGTQLHVHYSGATYNRWDYDPSSGKYLRFSDTVNVTDAEQTEQYAPLTDRLTNQTIALDNVVVLFANHAVYSSDSNGNKIYDILLSGSGDAYAFRDGLAYQVQWQRKEADVVSLTNPDGTPFPFRPGTTWFEVVGSTSTIQQTDQSWRFTHLMP